MAKTAPKPRLRRARRYGSIALVGASSTGKTAYLVALDLSTDARKSLTGWHLDESPQLRDYVANLGEFIAGTNRRRLQQTQRGTASGDLALFSASHRSALPRALRHKYEVAIPDMAGEVYNLVAGLDKPATEEDKKAAASMLATLRDCRALICLIDVTPRFDRTPAAELRRRQKGEIARQMKGLDHVLRKLRRPGQTLVVTLALTKCDTIPANERSIELPNDECARYDYLLSAGLDPLECGMATLDGDRVRYSLADIDQGAAATSAKANVRRPWADDLMHHEAVARDWLRCHVPAAYEQFEATTALEDLSLDVYLISSWGGALTPVLDTHEVAWEAVPEPGEIRPVRLFAPICSVLDRLHEGRVRHSVAARLTLVAAVLLLGFALGPAWVWWFNACARDELAQANLAACQRQVGRAAGNPLLRVLPGGLRRDVAKTYAGLAQALAQTDAGGNADPAALAIRASALACSKRAIELGAADDAIAWRSAYLRVCVDHALVHGLDLALGYLLDSRGVVAVATGTAVARVIVDHATMPIETEVDSALAGAGLVLAKASRDRAVTVLSRLNSLLDEVARPGFCIGGAPAEGAIGVLRTRTLGLHALVEAAAWANVDDLEVAKTQAHEVMALAAAATRCVQDARPADAKTEAWVRDVPMRCIARALQQPALALAAAAAALDPSGLEHRLDAVLGLRSPTVKASGSDQPVRAAVSRFGIELAEAAWQTMLAGSPGANGSGDQTVQCATRLLRKIAASDIQVPEASDLEFGERLWLLLSAISRDDYSGALPESLATLQRALELAADSPRIKVLLDSVRTALERTPEKPGTLEPWIALASSVAQPDRRLAVLLADAKIRQLFVDTRHPSTGVPAASACQAVAAVLADDQGNRHRMLGLTGDWLARSAATLDGAFALRRAIDACTKAQPELRPRANVATDLFRRTLLLPPEPLDREAMHDAILGVLDGTDDPEERAADLSLLVTLNHTDRTLVVDANSGPRAGGQFAYLDSLLPEVVRRIAGQIARQRLASYRAVIQTLEEDLARELDDPAAAGLSRWLEAYGPLEFASTRLQTLACLARLVIACQVRQPVTEPTARVLACPASEAPVVDKVLTGFLVRLAAESPEIALVVWQALGPAPRAMVPTATALRLVLGRQFSSKAAPDPADRAVVERYLQALASGPGDQVMLSELLAASVEDKLSPQAAPHADLIARRVSEHLAELPRERAFRTPIEAAALQLQSAKPERLAAVIAGSERHRALAANAGATRAAAALDAIQHAAGWLSRNDLDFRLVGSSSVFVTRDEVSLRVYRTLLAEEPRLRVSVRLAGDELTLAADGASDAFSRRFKSDGEAVFGVDPTAVNAYLTARGARLPTTAEWLACYGAGPAISATQDQILDARTGADLESLGDVSGPLRGMRYGVREWVIADSGQPRTLGASWMRAKINAREPLPTRVSDTLDVGFRIAVDAEPKPVAQYLEFISK